MESLWTLITESTLRWIRLRWQFDVRFSTWIAVIRQNLMLNSKWWVLIIACKWDIRFWIDFDIRFWRHCINVKNLMSNLFDGGYFQWYVSGTNGITFLPFFRKCRVIFTLTLPLVVYKTSQSHPVMFAFKVCVAQIFLSQKSHGFFPGGSSITVYQQDYLLLNLNNIAIHKCELYNASRIVEADVTETRIKIAFLSRFISFLLDLVDLLKSMISLSKDSVRNMLVHCYRFKEQP